MDVDTGQEIISNNHISAYELKNNRAVKKTLTLNHTHTGYETGWCVNTQTGNHPDPAP